MSRVLLLAPVLTVALVACGDDPETQPRAEAAAVSLTAAEQRLADSASQRYADYVSAELDDLVRGTSRFVEAVRSGDDDRARAIYPVARSHWERVEPIAASFGDLDPAIDAREAGLGEGEDWTGWHRLEKVLWPERDEDPRPLSDAERVELADRLLADTRTIREQGEGLELTVTDIVGGSQGLLEEVAAGKVTGEEEYWSRTDLWDFQANIDGARTGFELVEPLVAGRDQALSDRIAGDFAAVQTLLDASRRGEGFVGYDELSTGQVTAFSDAVNALGESLAEVSSVLG